MNINLLSIKSDMQSKMTSHIYRDSPQYVQGIYKEHDNKTNNNKCPDKRSTGSEPGQF